jgi:hypothetical protein
MHNAPPVVFPVGRFVWGRALWLGAAALSALGLMGWQVLAQVGVDRALMAWGFWAFCGVGAGLWGQRQVLTVGQLRWNGQSWFWQRDGVSTVDGQAVSVSVGLDAGVGLLLWVQPLDERGLVRGQLVCAWLQAQAMPSKWHGLRCAVYSRPDVSPSSQGDVQGRP